MADAKDSLLVFLLMGQSNLAGRGVLDTPSPAKDERIVVYRDGGWVTASEPLHSDPRGWAGAGLGMSFAQELLRRLPNRSIGLIPCAVGGSPLADWMPGAPLYSQTLATARAALNGQSLAAGLWHQGETDGESEADAHSYLTRARVLFASLRSDLPSPHAAIIIGELGRYLAKSAEIPWSETVNDALRTLAVETSRGALVSSEGLTHRGDHLHFDTPSLRTFGTRYARAYLSVATDIPGS